LRRSKLPVPPSIAIAKVKSIASSLSIPKSNFKASWQWLSRFRMHRGLQKMLLHGEGVEVNKNNLELLTTLKEIYEIIAQYDPKNIYNMDEIGLFFRLLPRYLRQMAIHDMFN
jgi:5-bromo-4-chloroindolyl phosphate hydrolysis protein